SPARSLQGVNDSLADGDLATLATIQAEAGRLARLEAPWHHCQWTRLQGDGESDLSALWDGHCLAPPASHSPQLPPELQPEQAMSARHQALDRCLDGFRRGAIAPPGHIDRHRCHV